MNRPLQQLIDALREELQQCGEMLAQLDEPARLASANSPGADWPGQPRADALLTAREAREFSWQQLAWAAQKPQAVSIGELIPCLHRARRTSRKRLDLITSPDAATAGLTRPPRVSAA